MWFFMGSLALELGKTMEEMMSISVAELNYWHAFYKKRNQIRETEARKARNK